jgi:DNA-binding HxlR family transcriptional regulator
MRKKDPIVLDRTCTKDEELKGAMDTIAILSGKWKIQLITTLSCGGSLQFMEILRLLDGIGAKMLSKELNDLELNLLLKRTVMDTIPTTVRYELTPHGRTLERLINDMREWGRGHRKVVMGTRGEEVEA